MNCPNCGTRLTCGCQKRTASNQKTVCQNCISAYEAQLKIDLEKFKSKK